MKKRIIITLYLLASAGLLSGQVAGKQPVKIGIAGLTHSHVLPLLRNLSSRDFKVVGISEANRELALKYAREMAKIAEKHKILLLTNYETSWYPSNHKSYEMISNKEIGDLRRIIVYDGHKGPEEIRVNPEFLDWLTDPVMNGGGAVTDFGCYGADLITWILKGEKPQSVYAVLKQYKPSVYPKVDDDATIVLSYPSMTGIINASWNWPFNRKDMHIYGTTGYIYSDDQQNIRYRLSERSPENYVKLPLREEPFNNPFSFFAAAIRGDITVSETDLSSIKINLIVVEILEAARKSQKTGRSVKLISFD